MFRNVNAFILDCDGLLVESELLQFKARQKASARFERELTEREFLFWWFEGNGGAKSYCEKYDIPLEEYQALKHRYYHEFIDSKMRLCRGVEKFLKATVRRFSLALCSNARKNDIHKILEKFKLANFFQVLVTGDDLKRAKPWPDGYLLAAKRLKIAPAEALVFENSHIGLAAAKAAGMKCVVVPDVFGKKFHFGAADAVLESIDEALPLFQ